jgi:hypothetical protein
MDLLAALYDESYDDGFVDTGRRIDLDNLPLPAKELFRFTVPEIYKLCELLRIPKVWKTKSRYVAHDWEVLCMLSMSFERSAVFIWKEEMPDF